MSKIGDPYDRLTGISRISFLFIPGVVRHHLRSGGAYRDRTDDPLLAKQVLSQLS